MERHKEKLGKVSIGKQDTVYKAFLIFHS